MSVHSEYKYTVTTIDIGDIIVIMDLINSHQTMFSKIEIFIYGIKTRRETFSLKNGSRRQIKLCEPIGIRFY